MTASRKAILMGLVAVALWSTVATAFKIALSFLSVDILVAISCLVSTVILVAAAWWRGHLGLVYHEIQAKPLLYAALGLTNPILYYSVLLRAYDLLPAQQAQTINYTWAITLSILAIPVLGQRLGRRDWIAVILGYFGVVVIATQGRFEFGAIASLLGLLFALASTLLWAGFWLANTRLKVEGSVSLTAMFLMASPVALALLWWCFPTELSLKGLLAASYVGAFEMGITFLLWSAALKQAENVSRVANLIFLAPVLSLVLIQWVLGEAIHPATLIGFACIVPAVIFQQRSS